MSQLMCNSYSSSGDTKAPRSLPEVKSTSFVFPKKKYKFRNFPQQNRCNHLSIPKNIPTLKPNEKFVFFIRHGESHYNHWRKQTFRNPFRNFTGLLTCDPKITDPSLTCKGVSQCLSLQSQLEKIYEGERSLLLESSKTKKVDYCTATAQVSYEESLHPAQHLSTRRKRETNTHTESFTKHRETEAHTEGPAEEETVMRTESNGEIVKPPSRRYFHKGALDLLRRKKFVLSTRKLVKSSSSVGDGRLSSHSRNNPFPSDEGARVMRDSDSPNDKMSVKKSVLNLASNLEKDAHANESPFQFQLILTSPLSRALETATLIFGNLVHKGSISNFKESHLRNGISNTHTIVEGTPRNGHSRLLSPLGSSLALSSKLVPRSNLTHIIEDELINENKTTDTSGYSYKNPESKEIQVTAPSDCVYSMGRVVEIMENNHSEPLCKSIILPDDVVQESREFPSSHCCVEATFPTRENGLCVAPREQNDAFTTPQKIHVPFHDENGQERCSRRTLDYSVNFQLYQSGDGHSPPQSFDELRPRAAQVGTLLEPVQEVSLSYPPRDAVLDSATCQNPDLTLDCQDLIACSPLRSDVMANGSADRSLCSTASLSYYKQGNVPPPYISQIPKALPIISEFLLTSSDCGSYKQTLTKKFANMDFSLMENIEPCEEWWHGVELYPWLLPWRKRAKVGELITRETRNGFLRRVEQFKQFLDSRDETSICVVGHSIFFKALLGGSKFRNCEIRGFVMHKGHVFSRFF